MIGSRSMVTQGAWVRRGSILGEGTVLNPGIPVIDAETGDEVSRGIVPPNCVVVRAERKREFPGGEFYLPCALIIRPRRYSASPRPPSAITSSSVAPARLASCSPIPCSRRHPSRSPRGKHRLPRKK